MHGSGTTKRSHALAIRCYKLRQEGLSLGEIAKLVGIDKEKVRNRIILGERLLTANLLSLSLPTL